MDEETLTLAKNYTDSQRLGYIETNKIIFDGDTTGKVTVPGSVIGMGDDVVYAKVTDKVINTNDIARIRVCLFASSGYVERINLTFETLYGATIVTLNTMRLVVIVPEAASETVGVDVGTYLMTNNEDAYTAEIVLETVHPIDTKLLPSGVLPTVELETVLNPSEMVNLSEADNEKLKATNGNPAVVKYSVSEDGMTAQYCEVTHYVRIDGVHLFLLVATGLSIMSEDGETWVVGMD